VLSYNMTILSLSGVEIGKFSEVGSDDENTE